MADRESANLNINAALGQEGSALKAIPNPLCEAAHNQRRRFFVEATRLLDKKELRVEGNERK